MIVTELKDYDKKRKKLTADDGALQCLLYRGECAKIGLAEGCTLSAETLHILMEEVLKPRARKRVLYYLKNGDKTKKQITDKLREGLYPEAVIEDALSFLEKHRFVDDRRYAENFIEAQKGKRSKREIMAKLYEKGIRGSEVKQLLETEITGEEEYAACLKALKSRLGKRLSVWEAAFADGEEPDREEKQRIYAYLLRKGFSYEAAEYSFRHLFSEPS